MKRASSAKDVRKVLTQLRALGYGVAPTSRSHWRITAPDGATIAVIAGTSGDGRSMRNSLADLRAAGVPRLQGRYTPPKAQRTQ